jgi:predicted Zn finger-like uncharacterized protein
MPSDLATAISGSICDGLLDNGDSSLSCATRMPRLSFEAQIFSPCKPAGENHFKMMLGKRRKISDGITLRVVALFSYNLNMVETFSCPHCHAVYKLVRVKTPAEPGDHPVACLHCGHALAPRHNEFLLKYFLIERPAGAPRKAQAAVD